MLFVLPDICSAAEIKTGLIQMWWTANDMFSPSFYLYTSSAFLKSVLNCLLPKRCKLVV